MIEKIKRWFEWKKICRLYEKIKKDKPASLKEERWMKEQRIKILKEIGAI